MAKTCSSCGKGLRFGTKCHSCRRRSAFESDLAPAAADPAPTSARFEVRRVPCERMVFSVVDTLTDTVREVTGDPLDAADVAGRLNSDFVYAMGRRWPNPS